MPEQSGPNGRIRNPPRRLRLMSDSSRDLAAMLKRFKATKVNALFKLVTELFAAQRVFGRLWRRFRTGAAMRRIAASGFFDAQWYLETYSDVAEAGIGPLKHYARHGGPEGRSPGPKFDATWYLAQNPDVAESGVDPLRHYLRTGAAEGRPPHPSNQKKYNDTQQTSAVSRMALEYTLRSANDPDLQSSRIAFVTCLPPQDTGIATMSLYSWLGYEGPVDIFCPVVDLDWFFYLSKKLKGPSGLGPRLFDVGGFLTMDQAVIYEHIVIAVGNSDHHVYVFELLKKLSTVGSLPRVTLYVHDPCLLNLIQKGNNLNFRQLLGDIYRIDPSQVNSAALIEQGMFGARYFRHFGIKRFLVNSKAALDILNRDLAGTSANVQRIFHTVFLPAGLEELELHSSFDGISIGTFGVPGSDKGSDKVVGSVKRLMRRGHNVRLVIAGFKAARFAGEYRQSLKGIDCKVLDGPTDPQLIQCMRSIDVAVQLRMQNLGESTGIIPQLLHLGKSVIATDIGAFKEFGCAVRLISPNATEDDIADQIMDLLKRPIDRTNIKRYVDEHSPACFQNKFSSLFGLADVGCPLHDRELTNISGAIASRTPRPFTARQLLVDISALDNLDLKTGIQRVVRAILREWLINPPSGIRVEPVSSADKGLYRYARQFTLDFLNCPRDLLVGDPIETRPGDIFIGLDLHLGVVPSRTFYQRLRERGVSVYFVVYDLLPVLRPQRFPDHADEAHRRWLEVVAESDGAVCISKAVADELCQWVRENAPARRRPFDINWFHLGADIENSVPTIGIPDNAQTVLDCLRSRTSFLMVGAIEPRKGHLQVLDAFGQLWKRGMNVNLTIVGAESWRDVPQSMRRTIPQIMTRLHSHTESGRRLFWLNGPSDEYLEKIYSASSCLVAASEGEGFGIPLIEAARRRLPIIARDIAVFREVAGEHAFYFAGEEPDALAMAIKEWLMLYDEDKHPTSDAMPWLTWEQSAKRLQEILIKGDWYARA
jgi:glycosyltransferase involved in cell wall biosynthesis